MKTYIVQYRRPWVPEEAQETTEKKNAWSLDEVLAMYDISICKDMRVTEIKNFTEAGQIYSLHNGSAFVRLLRRTPKERNRYIYDRDGSFNVWDVEYFSWSEGRLVLAETTTLRMDGFGDPFPVDALPENKLFWRRCLPSGDGCDGHRYSTSEIVVTETGGIIGQVSWEEHRGVWVNIADFVTVVDEDKVDAFIEKQIKSDLRNRLSTTTKF